MLNRLSLFKKRSNPAQDFVDDLVGDFFELPATSRTQIECARLVAAHDTGGLRAGAHKPILQNPPFGQNRPHR